MNHIEAMEVTSEVVNLMQAGIGATLQNNDVEALAIVTVIQIEVDGKAYNALATTLHPLRAQEISADDLTEMLTEALGQVGRLGVQ